MSDQEDFGLDISSGLIRPGDGTFGVYLTMAFNGRGDVEPVRQILTDDSGLRCRFSCLKVS